MYIISVKLKQQDIHVMEPLFCFTRDDISDPYNDCQLPENLSKQFICNFDYVIDSDKHLTQRNENFIKEFFPQRIEMTNTILDIWNNCKKDNYTLKNTFNISYEDNETATVYIFSLS